VASMTSNALAMLLARLLPPAFTFAINIAVARLTGAEMLGAYVNLLAVILIFQAIAGAGVQFLVTREIAAFPERAAEHARQARTFGLLSGTAGTVLYVLYAWWLLPDARLAPALVLAATILPSAWIALQEAIFVATRSHHWVAVVALVENSVKGVLALAALLSGYGLLAVCVAIALARLVGLATGAVLLRRRGFAGTWSFEPSAVVPFTRAIAPFAMLFILSMAYFRIDVPIVHALAGEQATGFYGVAATLYGALLLLPESALAAAYPRLARAFHASRDGYVQATAVLAKLLSLALVPVSVVLICLAEPIVFVAYGAEFAPAVPVLRLLALALPLHALNGALGQALQAGGEQRAMLGIIAFSVAVHAVLNIVLVRAFGIQGAALTMIVSSSCVAAGALRALHTRVAPVHVSWRAVPGVLAVVGPLVLVTVAPADYRMAAGAMGLAWLVVGSLWHGMLTPADLAGMRAALNPEAKATA
jgi:O-antigen/teichoic acid export membrane protein